MRRSAFLAEHAQLDIDEAGSWYRVRGGPSLSRRFVEAVSVAIARIGEFPEGYPLVHGRLRQARVPRFPYVLLFVVESDSIVVQRCIHLRRDPQRWRADFD